MFKKFIPLLLSIIISSCGGNGGTDTPSGDGNTTESFTFSNLAELGTIVGGNVVISSRDEQYTFYATTTNENGIYKVDKTINQRIPVVTSVAYNCINSLFSRLSFMSYI